MMTTPIHHTAGAGLAIDVQGVVKDFRLDAPSLGAFVTGGATSIHRALDNIHVQVPKGTALGLIGQNGSGKTTMLRLLSRVSKPTKGTVQVEGVISTLINIASGFDTDFTGRENINLSCAVRGVDRTIARDIAQTVIDFSELGPFIDQPVKTYSSGMVLRLGFSIATHIPFDVLLMDEHISVGDEYFVFKCKERFAELMPSGRTFVLASHDLHMIREFCDQVLWLDMGKPRMLGPARDVVAAYQDNTRERERAHTGTHVAVSVPAVNAAPDKGDEAPVVTGRPARDHDLDATQTKAGLQRETPRVRIGTVSLCVDGQPVDVLENPHELNGRISVRYTVTYHLPTESPVMGGALFRNDGVMVFGPNTLYDQVPVGTLEGTYEMELKYGALPLLTGSYYLEVGVFDKTHAVMFAYAKRACEFRVRTDLPDFGLAAFPHSWELKKPG
jgi:lipopolysaccharide transport system ATP-binding protein